MEQAKGFSCQVLTQKYRTMKWSTLMAHFFKIAAAITGVIAGVTAFVAEIVTIV